MNFEVIKVPKYLLHVILQCERAASRETSPSVPIIRAIQMVKEFEEDATSVFDMVAFD